MGQHFLASEDLAERVVDTLGDVSQSTVLEIGPGRGIMTSLLAKRARRLIAVGTRSRDGGTVAAEVWDVA